jgi:hypothetical protein
MSVAESLPDPEPRRAKRAARKGPLCRPFTLFDGMIVIGVAAVGFATYRGSLEYGNDWYQWVEMCVEAFLLLATWLVVIFRFRRPRPSLRRMARQPGAVACFAIVAMHVSQMGEDQAYRLIYGNFRIIPGIGSLIWIFLSGFEVVLSAVVPICWALLLAGRRWRPEPGWIDSLGRWIGWAWIVWLVACPVFTWLAIRHDWRNAPGFMS